MKKIILTVMLFPSLLYAADFPHNYEPQIKENITKERGLPLKRSTEPSTWKKIRAKERYDYYSIPSDSRPSWKEFKSYSPKVRVEDFD